MSSNVELLKLNDSNIVVTVALPVYNSDKICWLSLESLCEQKNIDFDWELIIYEEIHNKSVFPNIINDYYERLKKIRCCRILFITNSIKVGLVEKWITIGENTSDTSRVFLLQAADCYSPNNRLKISYDKILNEDFDWYDQTKGYFYSFISEKIYLYDIMSLTNLNMSLKTKYIKTLINSDLKKGIDGYIYNHCLNEINKENRTIRRYYDKVLYSDSLDTQGYNNISINRENAFKVNKNIFKNVNLGVLDLGLSDNTKSKINELSIRKTSSTEQKNKYNISIIIPTYKNTQYIDECLNSIIESGKNYSIEVLVGIDACDETLNHIKNNTYPDFIKFYYFRENNGPYLIFNSLSQIASSNKLLFFGSDDIMTKITIGEVVNNLDTYDLVRLRYQNYVGHNPIGNTSNFGEGAFSINKNIFLSLNGFEPWRVAADSDFMGRIYKMRLKIYHTREIAFYYRQHPTSLTKRPDTGMGSSLRANYAKISKNKRNNVNPSKLHTTDFDFVDVNTYTIEIDQTLQKQLEEQRRVRDEKLNSVFNKTVRKTVEVINKKGDPVIIDRLDFLYRNNSEPTRIIKPNIPQDRQELINQKNNTNKNTIKKMFDIKPNHREGKNFITLGGKINK